jgi:alkaline phosphatase
LSKREKDIEGYQGHRSDGKDLIREWLLKKEAHGVPAKYIYNRKELFNLAPVYANVLGLFAPDHMPYHLDAKDDDPSLAEMTEKAVEILSQNKHGFFLFVEGLYISRLFISKLS